MNGASQSGTYLFGSFLSAWKCIMENSLFNSHYLEYILYSHGMACAVNETRSNDAIVHTDTLTVRFTDTYYTYSRFDITDMSSGCSLCVFAVIQKQGFPLSLEQKTNPNQCAAHCSPLASRDFI